MALGSRPASVATRSQEPKDERKEKLQRLKIENFQGEAASLRAKQLRKLHKGVARAMKDAEKRGLRPAFEYGRVILATDPARTANPGSVVRVNLSPSQPDLSRPISFRSPSPQTFTDGDYEITFIPYDDGDPNTWEGIIFRATPEIASDARFVVIDIQTAEPNVIQETLYGSDGGDPQPIDQVGPQPIMNAKLANPLATLSRPSELSTCSRTQFTKATIWSSTKGIPPQVRCGPGTQKCLNDPTACCTIRNIGPWLRCSARMCGYAAIGCIGPAWAGCWGTWCTAGWVYCLL